MDRESARLIKEKLTLGKESFIYFKGSAQNVKKSLSIESSYHFFFFDNCNNGPYFPILDIIKYLIASFSDKEIVNLLENSGFNPRYVNYLKSYLTNEDFSNVEELFLEEIDYLAEKFEIGLISLLKKIAKQSNDTFFMDISNKMAHRTLKFLYEIIKNEEFDNIKIVFCLNETTSPNASFNKICEYVKPKTIVSWYDNESIEYSTILPITSQLKTANEMLLFFCFEGAHNILNSIFTQSSENANTLSSDEQYRFYTLYGDYFFYIQDVENAMFNYNKLLGKALQDENNLQISIAYLKIANLHLHEKNVDETLKTAHLGLKFAELIDNKILICKANYYLLYISGTELQRKYPEVIKSYFKTISEIAPFVGLDNIYLVAISTVITNSDIHESFDTRIDICKKGVEFAKKVKNDHKLASLYHNMAMIYSSKKDSAMAFEYLKKSEKHKLIIGDKLEISRIYNGIGYQYFLGEEYQKAFKYYNKALEYLLVLREYNEVCLCLYNMAIACVMTENYETALFYLESIITIASVLKLKEFPFHTLSGVYALIALSEYKVGNIARMTEYYNKVKEGKELFKFDEFFFFVLLKSFYESTYNNDIGALEIFKEHEKSGYIEQLEVFEPFFYYEYGKYLKNKLSPVPAIPVFRKGEEIAKAKGYNYRLDNIRYELGENHKFSHPIIKKIDFNIQHIFEYAEKKGFFQSVQKRNSEIGFLNSIQKILMNVALSRDEVLLEFTNCVKNFFVANKVTIVLNRVIDEQEKKSYEEICNILLFPLEYGDNKIGEVLLTTVKKDIIFDSDDQFILSIAVKQLSNTLAHKELAAQLERKNLMLIESTNKLKSIEQLISFIYNEKNRDKMIDYMMVVLMKALDLKYERIFFFEYFDKENNLSLKRLLKFEKNKVQKYNRIFTDNYSSTISIIDDLTSGFEIEKKPFMRVELKKVPENFFTNFNGIKVSTSQKPLWFLSNNESVNTLTLFPVVYESHMYGLIAIDLGALDITEQELEIIKIFIAHLSLYFDKKRIEKIELEMANTNELRCPSCNRKLLTYKGKADFLEVKCPSCNTMSTKND